MKHFKFPVLLFITIICIILACEQEHTPVVVQEEAAAVVEPDLRYGFDFNLYEAKQLKIKSGDTFGTILERNGIDYPQVYKVLEAIKGQVSVRKLQIGKPYTLLFDKDCTSIPKAFIYHPNALGYSAIQLSDSIYGTQVIKPIKTVELEATGIIESSLYETMLNSGYNNMLTYYMADVYAWTIDFTRLDKGDRFKVIYTEKFVDDSISVGLEKIKAAYFEHRGKGLYAYEFETDSIKGIVDYFDDQAKNLRRAFLKAPVKFSRISSRYNLKRRIAYYGRVKPHRGTDYAAAVGTPIMATANGQVIKSSYTRGNGNYVKIQHNNTYATQYLHMKSRKVKVGQYVKQGDVIGWVGMTGNTSGPHVCYRFWKNGQQVDPFKQKLPEAKPISAKLKQRYFTYIKKTEQQLKCISFEEKNSTNIAMN